MKYAALYRDKGYIFGYVNSEGRFEYKSSLNDNRFYIISDKEFEMVKMFNFPNLGYNKLKDGGYEIFDKEVQKYEEYEVPVFIDVLGEMTLSEKRTLLVIPTEQTIKAAHNIYSEIMEEIFEYDHAEEITKLYKQITEGNGIAFIKHEDYPYLEQILYRFKEFKTLFVYQRDSYIVGIKQNNSTMELEVYVPKDLAANVIGKSGRNIKEMSKILGVRRIKVISN